MMAGGNANGSPPGWAIDYFEIEEVGQSWE